MEAYAFAGIREQKRRESAALPLRRRGANRGAGFTLTAASAAPAKGKKGAVAAAPVKPDLGAVLKKASASAFRGGVAGFAAGVVQARPPSRRTPHGDPLRSQTASADARTARRTRASRWAASCGCAR